MAGMRLFLLSEKLCAAYCGCSLLAADCSSSQIAIEMPVAVPLWKVIVGPAPTNYNRTRKGPVFFVVTSGRVPPASSRVPACPGAASWLESDRFN
jgi:hypothetical protein